eukprot:m.103324 g.103324  ORF g.103324 m.103324 type:complete len:354 (-) comp13805_c0_seq12:852-1913(-)
MEPDEYEGGVHIPMNTDLHEHHLHHTEHHHSRPTHHHEPPPPTSIHSPTRHLADIPHPHELPHTHDHEIDEHEYGQQSHEQASTVRYGGAHHMHDPTLAASQNDTHTPHNTNAVIPQVKEKRRHSESRKRELAGEVPAHSLKRIKNRGRAGTSWVWEFMHQLETPVNSNGKFYHYLCKLCQETQHWVDCLFGPSADYKAITAAAHLTGSHGDHPRVKRIMNKSDRLTPPGPLRVKRLSGDAHVPEQRGAGFELRGIERHTIPANGRGSVSTGLSISVPQGCYGRLVSRSESVLQDQIHVGEYIIEPASHDNINVILFNYSTHDYQVQRGDPIALLLLERIWQTDVLEVQDFGT